MKRISATLVLAFLNTTIFAGDIYWAEGEKTSANTWVRHSWYSGKDKIDKSTFSGGDWASHWSKNKGQIIYRFEMPAEGQYDLWVRGILAPAKISWKLDDQKPQDVALPEKTEDSKSIGDGPRVFGWLKYGELKLAAGEHTLSFTASVDTQSEHKGNAYGGIDCFALVSGEFKPDGTSKPKEAKELKMLPLKADAGQGWFDYLSDPDDFAPSAIDVSHLIEKPAGKHGPVGVKDGAFVCEDGTRLKFLGTNLCNKGPGGADKALAEKSAKRFAKYGINSIRFHKFCHPGEAVASGAANSTDLDESDGGYMDKMDFFVAECKKNGIYITWSPIYGHVLKNGDKAADIEEMMKNKGGTAGLVNFAQDIQDVHIQLLVNLLNHKNKYTGLRYADEPALAFVEIQNEDDIFWNYKNLNKSHPNYFKKLTGMFSDYLTAKYKTHADLLKAWGEKAMEEGEDLAKGNINIVTHGWWYSEAAIGITDSGEDRSYVKARTLDAAAFLHETQNKYYSRAIDAMRKAGYKGAVVGSCWHTGGGMGHWYNLYSDYLAGVVDRHNYFGGCGTHRMSPGPFQNVSHLTAPGSGILGMGAQQVKDRPFTISEWLTLLPTMWIADGQAVLGAYGMGLQDWDGIYMFGSEHFCFPNRWDNPRVYNADQPLILGANPALAYWIFRGDIEPGKPAAERQVRMSDVAAGKLTVKEKLVTQGDIKTFVSEGGVPPEAFAIGKVTLEFVQGEPKNAYHDLEKYWDKDKKIVRSNTGQLVWDYSDKGFFTLNSPKSRAVCGFVQGKTVEMGDVKVSDIATRFVALYICSTDDKPVGSGKAIFIAMARARNTGMIYDDAEQQVLATGGPPMQLEAVKATITLPKSEKPPVVRVLDQHGRRTDKTVPVEMKDGLPTFKIDESYKTVYYEIEAAK
ncbi:MAG: hypothetical protein HZA50_02610 [Planctomycetes bacterium]|nr:hypothetical protein [Planctomycetota bacterium]